MPGAIRGGDTCQVECLFVTLTGHGRVEVRDYTLDACAVSHLSGALAEHHAGVSLQLPGVVSSTLHAGPDPIVPMAA